MGKSREQILEQSRIDPVVYGAVQLYLTGDCTWEEAMEIAVLCLSNKLAKVFDELEKRMIHESTVVIPKGGE